MLTNLSAMHTSRINVMEDDGEYETSTEEKFDLVNAFLAGFKSDETFPSAMNCSRYLEESILVLNDTTREWKE